MSKNRVFGRPMPDASVPRNGFDLSKRITMQLPFGAIIPCYAHQYLAGSQVRINVNSFFRTAAVNTAAFPRLKMETEFFCVPLRYLWSYWDNFKLGIKDYNSTALMDTTSPNTFTPTSVPQMDVFAGLWDAIANSTGTDSLHYPWGAGAARLADMLGYGRYNSTLQGLVSGHVQAVSMFKAAAYQKVYYDHFRNTAYESNDPFSYNLDCLSAPDSTPTTDIITRLFTLRYVNYRKDYFQSIFPGLNFIFSTNYQSPIFNNNSVPSWIRGVSGNLGGFSNPNQSGQIEVGNPTSQSAMIDASTNLTGSAVITVQQIRAAFALDKLSRSAAYAPQHVKQQYEARYGIKFPASSSFESQRIGSFDTDIVIGEVTSTANTENSGTGDALGAIGGKGIGSRSGGQTLKFDVKEDSIIIGVCYAIPRTMYDSYRFDTWNMKLNRNDFFIPEFMNLGLKPVYQKEMSYSYGGSSMVVAGGLNYALGYQLPYMEYKADIDENHGLFADENSDLGQFTVHTNLGGSSYVYSPGVSYKYFKVKPSDMDSIFVNAYDGTESTDHLFGELTFNIACNQNMSVHGVPKL